MSSLSEQERIGLEEVFLSISSSKSLFQKWVSWSQNFSFVIERKKYPFSLTLTSKADKWLKNSLKKDKITKLFTKIQKRRKI